MPGYVVHLAETELVIDYLAKLHSVPLAKEQSVANGTQKIRLLPKDRFCDILETNLGP